MSDYPSRRSMTVFSLNVVSLLTLTVALTLVAFGRGLIDDQPPAPTSVVTITAQGLSFDAPDEIPQGWTTFRFDNASGMTHFALLERLPDGIGVEEHQTEVAPLFQTGFEQMAAGKSEAADDTFGQLPKWFGDVVFLGGPGLLGAGQSAQATVHLTPGTYLLECYVKTNGTFHSYNPVPGKHGMVREITVTAEERSASAPEPSVKLTLSAENGIERASDAPLTPGTHTVAVHFQDQAAYANFVGHDVHLARLEADTDVAALADWMDWTRPEGPTPDQKGMLKTFTVPDGDELTTRDGN